MTNFFHQFNPEIIEKYQENKQIKFKKTDTLDILEDEVLLTGKAKGNITTQGNGSYIDMDTNNLGNLAENIFNSFIENQIPKPKIKNKTHQKNT